MSVEKLVWDSDFFNLRIGRADIVSKEDHKVLVSQKEALKEDFDLVYVFSSHGLGFPAANAKLMDEKVVYALIDMSYSEPNRNVTLWDCGKGTTDDLLHLALVSGQYSRFKLDESLPTGSYERLYTRWIEQSVNGVLATEVFCYMVDEIPRGLVTLDIKNGIGVIGLVAIYEDFQHRGIGMAMMQHVIHYTWMKQCSKLSVATQLDNIPACRLYEKSGFLVESITDVWHWWL